MDTTQTIQQLQALIDTLRTETRTASVSPMRLAAIHQRLLDLLCAIDTSTFLRKDRDDHTPHNLQALILQATKALSIGQFEAGISGAAIDRQGNAEVESIRVRSYLQVQELIANRQRTIDSDRIFTEGDIIEEVTPWPDGQTYTIKIRPQWEGYTTSIREHTVCRGIFNQINPQAPAGQGQTSISGAVCYTSWFRVIAVNPAAHTLDIILYPDDQTPAGINFAPQPMMAFSRWGWSGASTDPLAPALQTLFYLSTTEGRLVKLTGVTKPIIDIGNIEFTLGTLPREISEADDRLTDQDHGIYVKNLISQNHIQLDHLGRPRPVPLFAGEYDPSMRYLSGDEPDPDNGGQYTQHIVTYYGCQWICNVTATPDPPSWKTTAWTFYLGDPTFKISLTGGPPAVNPRNFKFTLSINATKGNQDVTADILPQDILWTRYTESPDGQPRAASDHIWNLAHASAGLDLTLTQDDTDPYPTVPPVCIYTATVTLRDGSALSASMPL